MALLNLPSPLEELQHHPGKVKGIRIFIKRDDLIHPEISGNKWRKLKYNLLLAREQKFKIIVSYGGPWSNHLAALASAGKMLGFTTVGIIRGEEPANWSDTLTFCKEQGMQIHFISRSDFDQKEPDPDSIKSIFQKYGGCYTIPLGGEGDFGVDGCKEILEEITIPYTMVCVPVGTGTTLKGLAKSNKQVEFFGFSALKNASQHSLEFNKWLTLQQHVTLLHNYSYGGFAKSNAQLEDFIVNFYQHNKIMLEPVYTGKMMTGVFDMINTGRIHRDTHLICVHTGGLQGLKGFPDLHKRLFTS